MDEVCSERIPVALLHKYWLAQQVEPWSTSPTSTCEGSAASAWSSREVCLFKSQVMCIHVYAGND